MRNSNNIRINKEKEGRVIFSFQFSVFRFSAFAKKASVFLIGIHCGFQF